MCKKIFQAVARLLTLKARELLSKLLDVPQ